MNTRDNLKQKALLLLLLVAAGAAKAQRHEFAPVGAEWHYGFTRNIAGPMYYVGYERYSSIGDTVINGHICRVIKATGGESSPCENMGKESFFLYKDENRLFWFNEDIGDFSVLHDYSALQGESWIVNVGNCSFEIMVDSTSTVRIGEEEKRVLFVHDDRHYYDGCIIEDIGHTTMFFPRDLYWECKETMCDGIVFNMLRCYSNDDWAWQADDIPCDTAYYGYIHVISELSNSVSVYPTLVENHFFIEVDGNWMDDLYLQLVDIHGRVCKTKNLYCTKQTVSMEGLPSGMYYVSLSNKQQILVSLKIIKQ